MKVSSIQTSTSFGRALTTAEKKDFQKVTQDAKKCLGLDKTTATIFDFSVPTTNNKDTGIGTTLSDDAQKLAGMLKTMCGINSIQLQPQGEVSNYVKSPYSGTSFSLGMHIIDLTKLKDEEYGALLTVKDLQAPYFTKNTNHTSVNYDNVFGENGQKAQLQKAYDRFTKLDAKSPLKKEFEAFKKENSYWLEKDALFEAAAEDNGSRDVKTWTERDKNVFATKEGDKKRIAELKKVTNDRGQNAVDFEEFVQFIADKQQKEAKYNFNKQGIQIFGDCQIGFSDKDVWAHKSAFHPSLEFGCDLDSGDKSCWSRAIDFSKLNGEAGELLYNKFDKFFKRYNGVRIDAAWQLVHPMLCEPWLENGENKFDDRGNKLGQEISISPKVPKNGKYIIQDIVLKAADNNGIPHDKVLLELLGGNSYQSLDAVKGTGTTLIHITRHAKEDWGRVKHYETQNSDNKYQNMHPGDYTIGPGTHDDHSLFEQVENGRSRAELLANDLHLNAHELRRSPAALSSAIWAELFTTKNQFATLPDILGQRQRINNPNNPKDPNWTYRAPQNYEEEYHRNLSKGKGLNFAEALSTAIKAKYNGMGNAITDKLDKYARILKQPGPMTTKEADKLKLNA